MKHIKTFKSFLNEDFFIDNLEEKIKESVFKILRELGYTKRERFMSFELRDSGGMYNAFLNGEKLASFLNYTIKSSQSSEQIENTIRKAIKEDPKKFDL